MAHNTTQKASWSAIGVAAVTLVSTRPEFITGLIERHAGVLVACACAAVLSTLIPHRLKHKLARTAHVRALSGVICVSAYMLARFAWITINEDAYTTAHMIIDGLVGLSLAFIIPLAYELLLPQSLKQAWSRSTLREKRKKIIETSDGGFKRVDEDYPTDHDKGERTVLPAGAEDDLTRMPEVTQPRDDAPGDDEDATERIGPKP